MDRISVAVLDKIISLASLGSYVVFSEDELEEALPENADADNIKKCLKSLLSEGYIDVKYSSGNLYCIAPLKKYEEEIIAPAPRAEVTEVIKKPTKPISPFLAAFAGGALGSFIVSLIFALIGYAG